jgi:hypothetical protein
VDCPDRGRHRGGAGAGGERGAGIIGALRGLDGRQRLRFNAATGGLLWKAAVNSPVMASPVVAPGQAVGSVFVSTNGGELLSLGLTDGARLWRVDLGGSYQWAGAAADATTLYFCQISGVVLAFNILTKAVLWRRNFVGESFRHAPALAGGRLYVPGESGAL